MKMIDKNFKSFALALAIVFGGALSALAQDEVQYEDMFNDGEETQDKDLLSLIKKEDNLSRFAELLEQSGLDKSLEAIEGEVTILAPTNEAFKELTKARYEEITDPKNKAMLNSILQAHILPRKLFIAEFEGNQVMTSAEGEDIPVQTGGGAGGPMSVVIGGSTVMRPDVEGSNGVIHVVDRVIIPGETGGPAVGPF